MSPRSAAALAYAAVGNHSRVEDTDTHGLILMLFDGAIASIDLARAAIGRGELKGKLQAIDKALKIVEGLRQSLNMQAGGDLARRMDELYEFASRQLVIGNARSDTQALDAALNVLVPLRSGWAGMPR